MSQLIEDPSYPLAYLLTFRTYGTWHHGDERGSVDRAKNNIYRGPRMPISDRMVARELSVQKHQTFVLDEAQRVLVDAAIRGVCSHRSYSLHALNVRSNHGHVVAAGASTPEKMVEAFKSYSTRAMREAGLVERNVKIWARHASTRYLWKSSSVAAAIDYVLYSQGDEFPNFEELVG